MNLYDDTIAAISTPAGEGGIGIVRISGRDSFNIAERIFVSRKGKKVQELPSHIITLGHIIDPIAKSAFHSSESNIVDEVLVSIMKAPNTYTKEDIVEINCHGGMLLLKRVLEIVIKSGARLAEPGEFTLRAFLNGRIDLARAEAVLDIIRAKTEESGRIAVEQLSGGLSERIKSLQDEIIELCAHLEAYIDFPEEEIEPITFNEMLNKINNFADELKILSDTYNDGKFFREGLSVAIVGRPNVGKSSLLNALLARDRAIVTDISGTTRDVIEELLNINGIPVRIMDTAGIREVHNLAEREGVNRSLRVIGSVDIILSVFDNNRPLNEEDRRVIKETQKKNVIHVINKSDLPEKISLRDVTTIEEKNKKSGIKNHVVRISAKTGDGIDRLKDTIFNKALTNSIEAKEGVIITNLRHKASIDRAEEALRKGFDLLHTENPLEIVAIELRSALNSIGEVIGTVTTEDILQKIFSDFCIGK